MNRLLVLVLLITILCGLHYYQDKILAIIGDDDDNNNTNSISKKKKKKQNEKIDLFDKELDDLDNITLDNITLDNISQCSVGSLDELKKELDTASFDNENIESFGIQTISNETNMTDASGMSNASTLNF